MPVEYSAITYILFSLTFLFNIKALKPFVTFAAFLLGIGYLVTFPFLGSAFISGNGLTTTLLALFNHSLLYMGSIIVMKHFMYQIESRKSILIGTLLVVTFSITMQYFINFDNKFLFIYMLLDGRILYNLFENVDINGLIFLPYNLLIISIYLGMISIFYKVNTKLYNLHHIQEKRSSSMNIQYKKGVLDLLVLSMLEKKDQYGYDISDTLSMKISLSPGTVYPILRKLKDEGLVITYLSETSGGPARKYYKITQSGKKKLIDSKAEWIEFVKTTLEILEVGKNE